MQSDENVGGIENEKNNDLSFGIDITLSDFYISTSC